MPEQLALAGFDAAPRPTDRLFFAIFPDADAAARIAQLAQHLRDEQGLKGRPLAPERFHITLHHLGDYVGLPQGIVAAASDAAATVAMPPFEVAFDRAESFFGRPRNRPFVLRAGDGVAALRVFQQTLGEAMKKTGLGRWVEPQYTPHVTLLYDDRHVAEQPIETIGWRVHEFVLVHSLLGQGLHVPLARWPLRV
ncbi:MAG: RNA 2',3'-cyclic phosphodiesterase [Rhodoferax sp.]|nr:RNA 2',3'-cyclic phosphodiesterase [Rhodoferax sp.]